MKKNKIEEVFKDILGIIWGSEEEPKQKKDNNIGEYIGLKRPKQPTVKMGEIPYEGMWEGKVPKRARTGKGRYKGDDKSTKDVNEAWVGGKAPKKKKRKK